MTDEAKIGQTVPGSEAAEAEPAWFAEVWSLTEQGVSAADAAKAVGKRAADVRKLIKRKKEAIEAEKQANGGDDPPTDAPGADEVPSPAGEPGEAEPTPGSNPDGPPVQVGKVSAEQAQRLQTLAGDSAGDDPEPELFPLGSIEGDGFTHKQIGSARQPVTEITVSMMGGEVPMPKGSGLLDPNKEGLLLVTYECRDGGLPIPIREGDRGEKRIVGWKTRQQVRPIYIERVKGEEGVIEAGFASLLEASPTRAGALLDQLLVRAGRKLES